jgi:proline iminopeptidase
MPLTEAPGAGRLVEIDSTRLFVVERSVEGLPVIVLHGGPGRDHWEFADYLDPLAHDLRLILVDQRGHGMSDPAAPGTLALAQLARDVVALADALELGDYCVLGHSFGGRVALRLALDAPERLSRLVLSCTTPAARFTGETPGTGWRTVEDLIARLFADPSDERLADYLRRRAPEQPRPELASEFPASDTVEFDVEARLGEISVPALVLAGARDRIRPPAAAEALAAGIPDARLVVFEQSGHLPFVEEQDAYLAAVRSFLLG